METFAIVGDAKDAIAHLANGYCLVVQSEQKKAFLVEGMFAHGANRDNVPVLPVVVDAVLSDGNTRELTEKEIRENCRPLHRLKGERVFGARNLFTS